MKQIPARLLAAFVALGFVLAACGGGTTTPAANPTAAPAAPAATTAPEATSAPAPTTAAEAPTAAAEAPTAAAEAATAAPEPSPTPIVIVDPNAVKADPNKTQIRWFVGLGTGTDPEQLPVEQKVVEDFNASHPKIQLILEVITYNAARDTLSTEIASGNPPDIVGPVGVGGSEAFHGQWLDLSEQIKKTNYDLSQFDTSAVDFYKGGEGQIGLPFAIYPGMLYYQKAMFEEAGLKEPPHKYGEMYELDGKQVEWNFDTFAEVAKRLTVDKNGRDATEADFDPKQIVQYGYQLGFPADVRDMGAWFGADSLVEQDGKTARIPPQWAEAWKWYYDGIWKSHFIPDNAVAQSPQFGSGNGFGSGKIAMSLSFLWYNCCFENTGDKWDIAAVPSHKGKATALLNADTFRIFKSTKHPDEAFEVLTYLLGEASPELLKIYGGMPARKADQDKFFESLNEKFPQKPDWQVAREGLQHPDIPSFEAFMPNYNKALDLASKLRNKIETTPDLDMDKEIAQFKTDLQAIFNEKQ